MGLSGVPIVRLPSHKIKLFLDNMFMLICSQCSKKLATRFCMLSRFGSFFVVSFGKGLRRRWISCLFSSVM